MVRYFIGNILNATGVSPENDPTFDFTKEESRNLKLEDVPVRMEHHPDMPVGKIIRGWSNPDGSHYVLGKLEGNDYQSRFAQYAVDKNEQTGQAYYSGLSLQHTHRQFASGKSEKTAVEVSLCCEPRRPNTRIMYVDSEIEPSEQQTKNLAYKLEEVNNQMEATEPSQVEQVESVPQQANEESVSSTSPGEMSREDMMKVIINQQKELEKKSRDDDAERRELLELKKMMEEQKKAELDKAREKSGAMIEALVNDWGDQLDRDQMTDSQKDSMRTLVKQFPKESMELLRVAHCASKHAKRQAEKFAEFKALTEKTALSSKFEEVMKKKRPAPTVEQAMEPQVVVHAASNKRQKMVSDAEAFAKAMHKFSSGGSARDHMETISQIGQRKRQQPRSYF